MSKNIKSLTELKEFDDLKVDPDELKEKINNYLNNVSKEQLIKDLKEVGVEVKNKKNCPDKIKTTSLKDMIYLHDTLLEIFDGEFIMLEKFEGTLFIDVHTKISGEEAYRRKKNYQDFLLDIYENSDRKVMVGVVFNS